MKRIVLYIFLALVPAALCAQQNYWQQRTDYALEVTLNDRDHSLDGFVSIRYQNNSPDTLHYIWFHTWPNAYKNDQTAFSNQLLENGRKDFYFSQPEQRGYMNRLDFKVNGITASTEDHPQHIDILRLLLPQPLPPGHTVEITSPFHVKIPAYFSRLGHVGQQYLVTQWYPKPAVYDREGWHPMPYLDQGEFYSEWGNFDVKIHVPKEYVVASGGIPANSTTADFSAAVPHEITPATPVKKTGSKPIKKTDSDTLTALSSTEMRTWYFKSENAHDFAWFAGKNWIRKTENLRLPSGKNIEVQVYFQPWVASKWENALLHAKRALSFYSDYLGDYPYPSFSVVAAPGKKFTGMEYPGITLISSENEPILEQIITHEAGHNWFQAALATNERDHPWMDEGMNTWMEQKYLMAYKVIPTNKKGMDRFTELMLAHTIKAKRDQPIATAAEKFSVINYGLIAYQKTAQWMNLLEQQLGAEAMKNAMRNYYTEWKGKHPSPADFKLSLEKYTGQSLDTIFNLLYRKGPLSPPLPRKKPALTGFYNLNNTDKTQYISLLPVVGFNSNDGLMPGLMIHNYQLPLPGLRFLAAPVYGTVSKQWNGMAKASYHTYREGQLKEWSVGIQYTSFSAAEYKEGNNAFYFRTQQLTPELVFKFSPLNERSTLQKTIRFRPYFFKEESLLFKRVITGNDTSFVPGKTTNSRYLNQLSLDIRDTRILYPYSATLVLEQIQDLIKAGFTGNYFFNYGGEKNGGLSARIFAGKILYTGNKTISTRFSNSRYHLNMTGPKGEEDYTYSNYFIGRNDFTGFQSQQMMLRDGAFKVRTDLLSNKVGKTDNWLAALNFVTDVPPKLNPLQVLPFKIPLKLFLDMGTYAEAWNTEETNNTARFLYDAGLQFSFFKEALNIYVPILYSKVYRDYFNSTLGDKKFWKTISFSIQLDALHPSKWLPVAGL